MEDHKHYNGICEKEFNRGYAFGRRESFEDIMRMAAENGGEISDQTTYEIDGKTYSTYQKNQVLILIPKELLIKLNNEVKRNL